MEENYFGQLNSAWCNEATLNIVVEDNLLHLLHYIRDLLYNNVVFCNETHELTKHIVY